MQHRTIADIQGQTELETKPLLPLTMFTLAHLSHVLLGSEDQFKVHYPLGELLEQTAVRVDVNRLERDEGEVIRQRGEESIYMQLYRNQIMCAVRCGPTHRIPVGVSLSCTHLLWTAEQYGRSSQL